MVSTKNTELEKREVFFKGKHGKKETEVLNYHNYLSLEGLNVSVLLQFLNWSVKIATHDVLMMKMRDFLVIIVMKASLKFINRAFNFKLF